MFNESDLNESYERFTSDFECLFSGSDASINAKLSVLFGKLTIETLVKYDYDFEATKKYLIKKISICLDNVEKKL